MHHITLNHNISINSKLDWIFICVLESFEYCKDTIRNEPNCVGFAREKAQTMSFVKRGFERLGLDH